ncbi:hypothetical protein C4M98_05010, partial [Mycoplasmopsis pullorum]
MPKWRKKSSFFVSYVKNSITLNKKATNFSCKNKKSYILMMKKDFFKLKYVNYLNSYHEFGIIFMKLNKKIKLGAILLSSSFLAPFVISASVVDLPKQSFDRSQTDSVDQPTTRLNFNDWMKYVDGNKTLSDLSIPGTHDSGMFASTHFTWGIAKA